MTGNEFKAALGRLGLTMAEAARQVEVHYTTLWAQANRGDKPVSGPYAAWVTCRLDLRQAVPHIAAQGEPQHQEEASDA